jgi:DNA polymerase-1
VILRRAGFDLSGIEFDTMVASCLVEETGTSLSLENLSRKHTSKQKLPSENFFGKGKTIDQSSIESVAKYACRDAEVTLLLRDHYAKAVEEEPNRTLYYDIDLPLSSVLAEMELIGVRVLPEVLACQSDGVGILAEDLARKIFDEVGEEFNLNSTQQLATILHDRLGLLSGRKRSTRADILERLANEGHTFAKDVLEYRHLKKLKSTYLDALPQLIHPETGRVHTSYSQTRAATGRISSSDPNLQNIPIRSELGRRIREAFVPEEGFVLFSADYSQIELRVVAHYTGDPGLVGAFEKGEDVHRRTGADIFGVPIDEVTPEQRNRAKAINFGLHYGMTEHGLADRLGIGVEEARDYMNRYFDRYPLVREHIHRTIDEATKKGYVTTLLGRRIDVSGLKSPNRNVVQNAQRAAINAPIQGTAADMLKRAMVGIARRLQQGSFRSRMILTVHDEVILETPEEEIDRVMKLTVNEMETALPLTVPVEVNTKSGLNWASLG